VGKVQKRTQSRSAKTDIQDLDPRKIPVGVVGLGLMGTSITACLLAAGHPVAGVTRSANTRRTVRRRLLGYLKGLKKEGLLKGRRSPEVILKALSLSADYATLAKSHLVVESTVEDERVKAEVFEKIEAVVSDDCVIGSNTSAILITRLQDGAKLPARVMGLHWGEPAHVLRFLEIICGDKTRMAYAEWVRDLSLKWGKEPGLLRRDIRGFITNRIFYAMLREAFHLVESGVCTIEDVDRSLRNDLGYWITLAGPFRFMDLTGVPAYKTVMDDLWPELSNETETPEMMKKLVKSGAKGVETASGFYDYTPSSARRWKKKFLEFSYEIHKLAMRYPE